MNLWFELNECRKVENTRSIDCNKECQKISPHHMLTGERGYLLRITGLQQGTR